MKLILTRIPDVGLFLTYGLVFIVTLGSCSDNPSPSNEECDSIYGTWHHVSSELVTDIELSDETLQGFESVYSNFEFQFNEDGNFYFKDGNIGERTRRAMTNSERRVSEPQGKFELLGDTAFSTFRQIEYFGEIRDTIGFELEKCTLTLFIHETIYDSTQGTFVIKVVR